jgi:membrane protease YdiL (CAAX protease family)
MTDNEQPLESSPPDFSPPEATPPPAGPGPTPEPLEQHPFWGYSDLALFAGLTIPSMIAGLVLVKVAEWLLHAHPRLKAVELLPAQFIGYGLMFAGLYAIFRLQYGKPFWESLGWRPMTLPAPKVVLAGVIVSVSVALGSLLLRTPDTANPMKEMLSDPISMILVGIFGTTLGPLCEELAFRGFLQPLLIRSFGVVTGIVLAAVPFGLLHLQQYGFSWRHALLITGAGAAFGWMRHTTNSTRASTLMHASYNGLFFLALFAQQRSLSHL